MPVGDDFQIYQDNPAIIFWLTDDCGDRFKLGMKHARSRSEMYWGLHGRLCCSDLFSDRCPVSAPDPAPDLILIKVNWCIWRNTTACTSQPRIDLYLGRNRVKPLSRASIDSCASTFFNS